jgi:hypothetical protein
VRWPQTGSTLSPALAGYTVRKFKLFRNKLDIAMGSTARVRFPAKARGFSLLYSFRTGSGAHPASYPKGTGGKAEGAWS